MLTYLEEEFKQKLDASRQAGETNCRWDGLERTEILPQWLGQGQSRAVSFPDLRILVVKAYTSPFQRIRSHSSKFNLISKFYLSGQLQVKTEGIAEEYAEVAGHNYLYCLPRTEEVEIYQSDRSTEFVIIKLTPAYLKTFISCSKAAMVVNNLSARFILSSCFASLVLTDMVEMGLEQLI